MRRHQPFTAGPAQGADRHPRPGRDHPRRPARRTADARLRRSRLAARPCWASASWSTAPLHYDEPGVLMSFEENAEELAEDVASLGFDLPALIERKRLALDYVHIDRSEIEETGEYDLEGLFVRLDLAVSSVSAKRVVLDTIESLFAGLENESDPPRGAAPVVPLAARPRPHRRDHRRKRRAHAHTARPRGIRLGRGDPARPPRGRPDLDAPDPRGQVPRLPPRHQRVPVPDRRRRPLGAARHLAAAAARRLVGARLERPARAGPDARRPRLSTAAARSWSRARPAPARPAWRRTLPTPPAGAANAALLPLRGVAAADGAQHARRPAWTCSPGWTADGSSFTRTGPRASAWKPTWSPCTAPWNTFSPTSSSWTR